MTRSSSEYRMMIRRHLTAACGWLFAAFLFAACSGQAAQESQEEEPVAEARLHGFHLLALSRGRGVPAEALEVLDEVVAACEKDRDRGLSVGIERTYLGVEGETLLCIEYEDREAADLSLTHTRSLTEGVDLVELVAEPCSQDTTTPFRNPVEN